MGQRRSTKFEILVEKAGFLLLACGKKCRLPTSGIRPFRPEFRTLLAFVGPSYPILWRCEPGLKQMEVLTHVQGVRDKFDS